MTKRKYFIQTEPLILFYRTFRRARKIRKRKKKIAPYLKKDFGVELNYKLWVTKGARFKASERNNVGDNLSTQTIGYLSAYLIIFNLITIYEVPFLIKINENSLGLLTTALSILILLYSQFENAKKHAIKSEKFHQCSLEIAELYNELRMVKTFENVYGAENRIKQISERYDEILKKYENHLPIDFKDFMTTKPDYFEIGWFKVWRIKVYKYFVVKFKYHLMIYGPLITFIIYQIYMQYYG